MNKNNEINKKEGFLIFLDLYNIIISLFNILLIFKINQLIRFGIIHIIFGNKIMIIIVLNQFNSILKIIVDGSKILNKFIIIFNYFSFKIFISIKFFNKNKI